MKLSKILEDAGLEVPQIVYYCVGVPSFTGARPAPATLDPDFDDVIWVQVEEDDDHVIFISELGEWVRVQILP